MHGNPEHSARPDGRERARTVCRRRGERPHSRIRRSDVGDVGAPAQVRLTGIRPLILEVANRVVDRLEEVAIAGRDGRRVRRFGPVDRGEHKPVTGERLQDHVVIEYEVDAPGDQPRHGVVDPRRNDRLCGGETSPRFVNGSGPARRGNPTFPRRERGGPGRRTLREQREMCYVIGFGKKSVVGAVLGERELCDDDIGCTGLEQAPFGQLRSLLGQVVRRAGLRRVPVGPALQPWGKPQ